MNVSLAKKLKSIYRKEKISGFIFTVGTVDAILGGFSERWTLLSLGVFLVILGGWMGWLKVRKTQKTLFVSTPRRYLSPNYQDLKPLPPLKRKRDYLS